MNVICSLSSAVWIFFLITKYKLELSHSARCTKFTITAILQLTFSGNDFLDDLDALLRSITFAFLLRALLVGGRVYVNAGTCPEPPGTPGTARNQPEPPGTCPEPTRNLEKSANDKIKNNKK